MAAKRVKLLRTTHSQKPWLQYCAAMPVHSFRNEDPIQPEQELTRNRANLDQRDATLKSLQLKLQKPAAVGASNL